MGGDTFQTAPPLLRICEQLDQLHWRDDELKVPWKLKSSRIADFSPLQALDQLRLVVQAEYVMPPPSEVQQDPTRSTPQIENRAVDPGCKRRPQREIG